MKKTQRKRASKHAMPLLAGSVLAASIFGVFMYFQVITHVAALLLLEIHYLEISQRVHSIPVPSALLLFGMGFMGLLCVRLAEKKKDTERPHIKKLGKAAN